MYNLIFFTIHYLAVTILFRDVTEPVEFLILKMFIFRVSVVFTFNIIYILTMYTTTVNPIFFYKIYDNNVRLLINKQFLNLNLTGFFLMTS